MGARRRSMRELARTEQRESKLLYGLVGRAKENLTASQSSGTSVDDTTRRFARSASSARADQLMRSSVRARRAAREYRAPLDDRRQPRLHEQHRTEQQVVAFEVGAGERVAHAPDGDRDDDEDAADDRMAERRRRIRDAHGDQREHALRNQDGRDREPRRNVRARRMEGDEREAQ